MVIADDAMPAQGFSAGFWGPEPGGSELRQGELQEVQPMVGKVISRRKRSGRRNS